METLDNAFGHFFFVTFGHTNTGSVREGWWLSSKFISPPGFARGDPKGVLCEAHELVEHDGKPDAADAQVQVHRHVHVAGQHHEVHHVDARQVPHIARAWCQGTAEEHSVRVERTPVSFYPNCKKHLN